MTFRSTIKPGMTVTTRHTVCVITVTLAFAASCANAAEESGHHEFPHHHVALFAGAGMERDSDGHEEEGTALGIKFETQFSESWGVGVGFEQVIGSDLNRSWVVAVPVIFHATESWRLFAGPGFESLESKDKYLMRVGIAYEISFHERWTATPEFLVDFIEGGARTYFLGIAVGYGF